MKWIAAILIAAVPATAAAHSWYPRDCCHGEDCVPVSDIEKVPGKPYQIWHTEKFGPVQVDDTVLRDRARISKDGRYHLCAVPAEQSGKERQRPLAKKERLSPDRWHVQCIFIPGTA
ncbi:MAG: hypothetical protein KJ622_08285 [Alphaproteobacteria bacterium]|nr:hypothetical protein [Alphaproteobacteria bacterium]